MLYIKVEITEKWILINFCFSERTIFMEVNSDNIEFLKNTIPGEYSIYKIVNGKIKVIYFSGGVPMASGMTHKEYADYTEDDVMAIVYKDDRETIRQAIEMLSEDSNKETDLFVRVMHLSGRWIYMHVKVRLIGTMNGERVMLCLFFENKIETQNFDEILNQSNQIVYEISEKDWSLLYANEYALNNWNHGRDYAGIPCYQFVHGRSEPCPWCTVPKMEGDYIHVNKTFDPVRNMWFTLSCKRMNWFGHKAVSIYATDITDSVDSQQSVINANTTLNGIIDGIPAGVSVFQKNDEGIKRIAVNHFLCEIKGLSKKELENEKFDDIFDRVPEQSRDMVREGIINTFETGHSVTVYQTKNEKTGKLIWVHREGIVQFQKDNSCLAYFSYHDITEQKETQLLLEKNRQMYQLAVDGAKLAVWEYDIRDHCILSYDKRLSIYDVPDIIENVPETMIDRFIPEDREKLRKMYRDLESGVEVVSEEFWASWTPGKPPRCERITYSVVFDDEGKPCKAYGVGQIVTAQKIEETKFNSALQQQLEADPNALCSFNANITLNTCEEVHTSSEFIKKLFNEEFFIKIVDNMSKVIVDDDDRREFCEKLDTEYMTDLFLKGHTSFELSYRRQINYNMVHWVTTYVHMTQNITTGDIEAFVYSVDRNALKNGELIIRRMTKNEYDFVAVIDVDRECFEFFSITENYPKIDKKRIYEYEKSYTGMIKKYIPVVQQNEYIDKCSLKNICEKLDKYNSYSINSSEKSSNGDKKEKQYLYYWLDDTHKYIIFMKMDTTDILQEEIEQNERLQEAVGKAQSANQLKTEFISNVSHDMRTPMNGIIGYTDLALAAHGEDVLRDYLKKIKASSQTLLMLIDDTLDLSRIENGKVEFHPVGISCRDIIESVIADIRPSADAKHISIILDNERAVMADIMVDILCMKKIFLNLVSNSIKFTPEGGKIYFIVECVGIDDDFVHDRIIIKDNGCGISDEFLPQIFDPFTQERNAGNAEIGGSGLGLSIVKKLIEALNGKIEIKSTIGVGTEVIVYIDFKRTTLNDNQNKYKRKIDYNKLKGIKVLLCEDNDINADIVITLLEKLGIETDCVKNGKEGFDAYLLRPESFYDIILMDIRMPVMDGFESARLIRNTGRADSKSIPIVAMTADVYEKDVQKVIDAGMNAHVAKPVSPEKLYLSIYDLVCD